MLPSNDVIQDMSTLHLDTLANADAMLDGCGRVRADQISMRSGLIRFNEKCPRKDSSCRMQMQLHC